MSSSIPSWQILTAHAQPFRGARDLAFCLKVPLTHCLYERAAKVLARLRGCAGSPEPSLLAYAISTKFAWRGPYKTVNYKPRNQACTMRGAWYGTAAPSWANYFKIMQFFTRNWVYYPRSHSNPCFSIKIWNLQPLFQKSVYKTGQKKLSLTCIFPIDLMQKQ